FSMGRFLNLFMLLTFAYAMVNYYDSSIPGLGFSIKGFIDGGQISAPTTEPAFADLASLPGESCGTAGFRRLLHGSDRDLPGSVCLRGAVACSTPRAALPGDGTPDSGVGHAANSGSISVAAGAEISTAGSRCDLWQRLRRPHPRHGDGGSGHRAASALAESLCGTAGGFHPARMSGPRHRLESTSVTPDLTKLFCILQL